VGLALEGAVVKQDKNANENLYGHPVDPKELLLAPSHSIPEPARGLVDFLGGVAPRKPLR
jgi:lipid-binding SYLF domain-containing protein